MLVLLLALSVTRCASAQLCPSDAELASAVRLRVQELAMQTERAKDPDGVILVDPARIKEIGDVHCGAAQPDQTRTINCSFFVRYTGAAIFQVATLSRDEGGRWTITAELNVVRPQ